MLKDGIDRAGVGKHKTTKLLLVLVLFLIVDLSKSERGRSNVNRAAAQGRPSYWWDFLIVDLLCSGLHRLHLLPIRGFCQIPPIFIFHQPLHPNNSTPIKRSELPIAGIIA